jgi:O-antigen ligase
MSPSRSTRARPGRSARGEQLVFPMVLVALALCFLGGGGSNPAIFSLLYLRPALILLLAAIVFVSTPAEDRSRVPLAFLMALAALMLIQLVPLPPSIWSGLPGREPLVRIGELTGTQDMWRPISLDPDATINSLLTLLPAAVIVCGMMSMSRNRWPLLVTALLVAVAATALLGVLQYTAGGRGGFYLYRVNSAPWPTGLFANRNHHAAFLAMGLPLLRVWILLAQNDGARVRRTWIAMAGALFIAASLAMTGSRAGLVVGALGVVAAVLLFPGERRSSGRRAALSPRLRTAGKVALVAVPLGLVAMAVAMSRLPALQRLISTDTGEELRVQWMPTLFQMVGDYFPVGTGFGVFDEVARAYEPDALLAPVYFNHAHSDPIELVLNGGAAAILLVVLFLIWCAFRAWRTMRPFRAASPVAYLPRLGLLCILILFAASIVDYPLRTPALAAVFAICCMWLSGDPPVERRREGH